MCKRYLAAIAMVSLISGCDSEISAPADPVVVAPEVNSSPKIQPAISNTDENIKALEEKSSPVNFTGSQINAIRSAERYLSISGFSRTDLIQQLSSDAGDGYPILDATIAVDSLSVDWNENAAKSARQYIEISGFSCKGLIEQLSSSAGNNYTKDQATYGASQVGACE